MSRQQFKAAGKDIKKFATRTNDVEQKVKDATSNEKWGASSTLMNEICRHSYEQHHYSSVMHVIWKRLNESGKNWRHVYKALTLLEYMVANANERVIDDCRSRMRMVQIRTLTHFQHMEEGIDEGRNVREKAKKLIELLRNDERIGEVRAQAKKNRSKFVGYSSSDSRQGISPQMQYSDYGSPAQSFERPRYGEGDGGADRFGGFTRGSKYDEWQPKQKAAEQQKKNEEPEEEEDEDEEEEEEEQVDATAGPALLELDVQVGGGAAGGATTAPAAMLDAGAELEQVFQPAATSPSGAFTPRFGEPTAFQSGGVPTAIPSISAPVAAATGFGDDFNPRFAPTGVMAGAVDRFGGGGAGFGSDEFEADFGSASFQADLEGADGTGKLAKGTASKHQNKEQLTDLLSSAIVDFSLKDPSSPRSPAKPQAQGPYRSMAAPGGRAKSAVGTASFRQQPSLKDLVTSPQQKVAGGRQLGAVSPRVPSNPEVVVQQPGMVPLHVPSAPAQPVAANVSPVMSGGWRPSVPRPQMPPAAAMYGTTVSPVAAAQMGMRYVSPAQHPGAYPPQLRPAGVGPGTLL